MFSFDGVYGQMRWFWDKTRGCRLQAALNVVIGLLHVASDFAFIFVSKQIIDTAVGSSSAYSLTALTITLVLIVALQISMRVATTWISAMLGVTAQNSLQQKMMRTVLDSVWQGRERRHTGDVVNRLSTDVGTLVTMAAVRLPDFVVLVVRLVCAFVFLSCLDVRLAVAVVVILPFFLLISRLYFRRMRSISREVRRTDSRVQSIMQEFVQHHLVVKTLQQVDGAVGRLSAVHRHLHSQILRRTRFSSFSSVVVSMGFSGVYLLAFIWGAYNLREGVITYGTMIAFVQLVSQIQQPFRELTRFLPSIISTFTSLERLMELDAMPRDVASADILSVSRLHPTQSLGVRFSNVSYRYSKSQRTVLRNLSIDFPPATASAILGETGAGKTTLIRLILALMQPNEGEVTVYDAHNAVAASPSTRSEIVYVPQGNTLLSGTIRDNLLFGCPTATDDDISNALTMACADFVYSLREGLETVCGEMGIGLSEGQAQRIAIARSLLRGGRIILLDEATSALDMETEKRLLANLATLTTKGKTLIFITHRQEVLDYCSQIYTVCRES